MLARVSIKIVLSFIILESINGASASTAISWETLKKGLLFTQIPLVENAASAYDYIYIVKADPQIVTFKTGLASLNDNRRRTAGEWLQDLNLSVAINLGLFDKDLLTNLGYMRSGKQLNNKKWASQYFSAFVFNTQNSSSTRKAAILDLDDKNYDSPKKLTNFHTVIQNQRLIKKPGKNVWTKQNKKWSEAALAEDRNGDILFIFCQRPYEMLDFNELLLQLPLNITKAMHLEGGLQASLSIATDKKKLNLHGLREDSMLLNILLIYLEQSPIPNVIGIAK